MNSSESHSSMPSATAPSTSSSMQTNKNILSESTMKKQKEEFVDESAGSLVQAEAPDLKYYLRVTRSHPLIWSVPLLIFAALAAGGISIITMTFNEQEETKVEDALSVAEETGKRFSDFLDDAMMPLFSLGQFVHELPEFRTLPNQIGPVGHKGSLPMKVDSTSHRNVTGVCDDPDLTTRFSNIASSIKQNAKNLQGVLVNLQLVPEGVVCLLHPVVNTEDFPPGKAMNNTGAIGHDLIADSRRRFHAEASLKQGDLVTVGPISLVQCQGCDPIVQQAFIARLPIITNDHDIIAFDGTRLAKRWGFAVALINWQALVEKTMLYEDFAVRGWGFQLTRIDYKFDDATESYTTNTVVLAETNDFQHMVNHTKHHQVVETKLDTTDSEWTIQVVYNLGNAPASKAGSIALTVFVSALIAMLAFVVLLQKQVHSELIKANLVRAELSAQAERDLNDFISHEIRNPLSAAMSAGTFLATSLEEESQRLQQQQRQAASTSTNSDETQSLVNNSNTSPETHQTMSEDVSIINSSLHFINDLLRNMLDMHRAASRQLVLDPSETEVMTDVLEPVAAMLQHRDREFSIHIVKDSNAPDPFLIEIDRLRLQQVILNLGRNSSKFVPDGPKSFGRLRAGLDDASGSIVLSVEDSGTGIPVSKRNNLFGKFQESLDSMSQGTGVGLNLCKTLVEMMGGDLYLDETYHSGVEGYPGARFVVHLKKTQLMMPPPEVASAEFLQVPASGETPRGDVEMAVSNTESVGASVRRNQDDEDERELPEQFSILFADDERILRKLATRAFKKLNPEWVVEETASGEAALQLCCEKRYDMIFLDQWFTGAERRLTGTETTRAMRAQGITSIICGCSANDLEDAFVRAGADCFTGKPFDTPQVKLKKFMLKALETRNSS